MKTYNVQIARTETTVYTIEVKAKDEDKAEEAAWKKYAHQEWDDEDIVYGEENIHHVEEI